jgi:hypothetical protein
MSEINESVKNEIRKASVVLDMEYDEAVTKYISICEVNNIDPFSQVETEQKLGLSLWRQWFSSANMARKAENGETPSVQSTGKDDIRKQASGFFISVFEARDLMALQATRVSNEYERDPETTLRLGKVAVAEVTEGGYSLTRYEDGVEQTMVVKALPANHIEVDVNQYIIPLDTMDWSKRKGKPLPKEQFRMNGVFLGTVDGDFGLYQFSYKGESSKDFLPKTFEHIHMTVIRNDTKPNMIYGFTNVTAETLVVNSDLSEDDPMYLDTAGHDIAASLMEAASDNYSPLVDLDRYHATLADKQYVDKYVVTDGSVSAINMKPNEKTGTRRMTINDLNSDFDYEGGGWAGTTCWVPNYIDIDFGIGSNVIVVGQTSQRTVDGHVDSATINVRGLYVIENRGSPVDSYSAEEEDFDWFA